MFVKQLHQPCDGVIELLCRARPRSLQIHKNVAGTTAQ